MCSRKQVNEILTRDQLAERLEISVRSVDNYVKQGKLTPIAHPLGRAPGRRVWFAWAKVKRELGIK